MMLSTKPKIAFFDFTGCEGCQLTVVDILQTHVDLLEVVDIVQFREAMSEREDNYQIAFVEGSCTRSQDETRLRTIRSQADIVIALGACAHIGGVNTIRNRQSSDSVRRFVYGETGKLYENYKARPIDAIIPVDGFVPGCPIDREEFLRTVKAFLQRRQPRLPDYSLCFECKLKENPCVFMHGRACLGPVTRAGCGAICPAFGVGCDGCRGLVSDANLNWLKAAVIGHDLNEDEFATKLGLFLSYQLTESEVNGNGNR